MNCSRNEVSCTGWRTWPYNACETAPFQEGDEYLPWAEYNNRPGLWARVSVCQRGPKPLRVSLFAWSRVATDDELAQAVLAAPWGRQDLRGTFITDNAESINGSVRQRTLYVEGAPALLLRYRSIRRVLEIVTIHRYTREEGALEVAARREKRRDAQQQYAVYLLEARRWRAEGRPFESYPGQCGGRVKLSHWPYWVAVSERGSRPTEEDLLEVRERVAEAPLRAERRAVRRYKIAVGRARRSGKPSQVGHPGVY